MFHGSIPALVTPFKNGAIDKPAFEALIERQIQGGSSAVVPCGTTGEAATLSHEEHRLVTELCVQIVRGRVPVIAGAGSNSTREAIELVAHAQSAGADAALVICPYYNKPDQTGLEAHFRAINDAVSFPVILYNVPSRTACDLLPETVGRLAKLPNVVGIKDASNDLGRVPQHANLADGHQFVQLSGEDPTSLGHLMMGGVGCISVTANVAPELCAKLHAAFVAGDLDQARDIDRKLIHLHKAMFFAPSPAPAKYLLAKMGLCSDEVRLPIVAADPETSAKIDAAMKSAGLG